MKNTVANLMTGMLVALAIPGVAPASSFVNFESGQVRPLALSPNRATLFALNTPDNRLEIYTVRPAAPYLVLAAEVTVGLEPVSVAPLSDTEVWVVNHLSDSISIVTRDSVATQGWKVSRTLATCDEPRDLVFSSAQKPLAFVAAARRGQTCPLAADSTTPGAGRGVVQVFDPKNLGSAWGGEAKANLVIEGDVPRALAADPDNNVVYASVFLSGSGTTTVTEPAVQLGPGLPAPELQGVLYDTPGSFPSTGLIVKRVSTASGWRWQDEDQQDWTDEVPLDLPDQDVFRIDAADLSVTRPYSGVGTVLFNMAVRPGTGAIYVSNLEARNEVRFEPVLQGHFVESRLTRISNPTAATPLIEKVDLNPHINHASVHGPPAEIDCSIGLPGAVAFSGDGTQLFVAGFGSGHVVIYRNVANLTTASCGSAGRRLIKVAAGPSGLAYDNFLKRLYVLSRNDAAITVISNPAAPAAPTVLKVLNLPFDPSPAVVTNGRKFLYDTRNSGHGDSSCAACHIFGDFDGLAWDLGNPLAPNPFGGTRLFHPMKGPMTTQSLRGMKDAGQMHWRADRFGATEKEAFEQFNPAFDGLLGGALLSGPDMSAFAEFALTIAYPPNPLRKLDDTLDADQAAGQHLFDDVPTTVGFKCSAGPCHANPLGTNGEIFPGEPLPQEFKVAHLRNLYQKVGMFASDPPQPQVRGFGYLHDGSVPTLFDFLSAGVLSVNIFDSTVFSLTPNERKQVEAYILAFDTGLKPIVGQQLTISASNVAAADVTARLSLLTQQAAIPGNCDLIAKSFLNGAERGWLYDSGMFKSDQAGGSTPLTALQAVAASSPVTFTCVPPGSGARIGINRDGDALLDGDDPNDVSP